MTISNDSDERTDRPNTYVCGSDVHVGAGVDEEAKDFGAVVGGSVVRGRPPVLCAYANKTQFENKQKQSNNTTNERSIPFLKTNFNARANNARGWRRMRR